MCLRKIWSQTASANAGLNTLQDGFRTTFEGGLGHVCPDSLHRLQLKSILEDIQVLHYQKLHCNKYFQDLLQGKDKSLPMGRHPKKPFVRACYRQDITFSFPSIPIGCDSNAAHRIQHSALLLWSWCCIETVIKHFLLTWTCWGIITSLPRVDLTRVLHYDVAERRLALFFFLEFKV